MSPLTGIVTLHGGNSAVVTIAIVVASFVVKCALQQSAGGCGRLGIDIGDGGIAG